MQAYKMCVHAVTKSKKGALMRPMCLMVDTGWMPSSIVQTHGLCHGTSSLVVVITGQPSRWVRTSLAWPVAFASMSPYAARQSSNTVLRARACSRTAAGGAEASRRAASAAWSRRPSETASR